MPKIKREFSKMRIKILKIRKNNNRTTVRCKKCQTIQIMNWKIQKKILWKRKSNNKDLILEFKFNNSRTKINSKNKKRTKRGKKKKKLIMKQKKKKAKPILNCNLETHISTFNQRIQHSPCFCKKIRVQLLLKLKIPK